MRNAETNIMNQVMLDESKKGVMLWRNNTGKFRAMDNPQRIVTVGQVGSADIIGVKPILITADMVGQTIGQAVAIEVKTTTGRQSEAQKLWQIAFEKHGGEYILFKK